MPDGLLQKPQAAGGNGSTSAPTAATSRGQAGGQTGGQTTSSAAEAPPHAPEAGPTTGVGQTADAATPPPPPPNNDVPGAPQAAWPMPEMLGPMPEMLAAGRRRSRSPRTNAHFVGSLHMGIRIASTLTNELQFQSQLIRNTALPMDLESVDRDTLAAAMTAISEIRESSRMAHLAWASLDANL